MIQTGLVRLGRDVELRYLPDGTAVANLALAYNYGRKDDQNNRPTQWVDAALFGKRAEGLAQYLTKGTLCNIVLNEVHIETYEGKNGAGHKLVGRVLEIELAGGGNRDQGQQQQSSNNAQKRPAQEQKRPVDNMSNNQPNYDDYDDDIPF